MSRWARIGAIARRELAAYFHAPIAWVVGVLFLAVQGFSFWAVVQVLADPTRKAPMGAVLRTHFGGTFLYWSVLFVLVATAAMRLVAEDRRHGNWEALLTTPVEEGEAIVGKWLGALGYYLVLWLPTLVFPLALQLLAPPGAGPALAPVATAYLGVALSGAGFLALALAASATTSNQVIAAVAGFVALMALLLVGQLSELVAGLGDVGWLGYLDVRRHMDAFARGDVDLRWLALYAGMVAVGLAAAAALAGIGRRRAGQLASRGVAAALVLVIVALGNALVARHPVNWDVTAAGVNSLEPATERVLAGIDRPVTAHLVRAGEPGFEQIYDEVERVLRRMAIAQPRLRVAPLDPVRAPDRVARLAADAGVPIEVLRGVGAVVFETGDGQVRTVELLDMAELGRDALDAGAVLAFRAEQQFASALLDLTARERARLCVTAGHGELGLEPAAGGLDARRLARRLQRAGYRVGEVGPLAAGVPATCRALLVLGPQRALPAEEALAIAAYLDGGGRALIALGARAADGGLAPHGLELVLSEHGVRTPDAIAVDPSAGVGIDYAWGVYRGYAEHPVTAGFEGRRLTVWTLPRVVLPEGDGAVALVTSTPAGWAETDIDGLLGAADVTPGRGEPVGNVPVAAAVERGDSRLVVFGSARPLASDFAERAVGANHELATSAVRWLVGRTGRVDIGDKTPERVRLLLSPAARRATFAVCVVGLPLAWALLGGLVAWRRRRRG